MTPKLTSAGRLEKIRAMVAQRKTVSNGELSQALGVSEMTIRRDLDELERQGQIRRTHGGAIMAERLVFELDFREQQVARRAEKLAIAREAVKLIQPGMRVMLDTGTSTLAVAEELSGIGNLTVITTSLAVLSQLQFAENINLIVLGGQVRRGNADLTGGLTEYALDFLAGDIAFLGADAVGPDGSTYNSDIRLARVDQKMRERCSKTYIVADSHKIGKTALARNGSILDCAGLITDGEADARWVQAMIRAGANVIVAK
jgi:DeoR/GlpR family transcriptional regulator of sugar metabolism